MKKKLTRLLCLLLAAALCCGCSAAPAETEAPKLTAAEIAGKMQEAVNAAPCTQLLTETSFTIVLDAGEVGTMELTTQNTTEMTLSLDPLSAFTAATAKLTMDGQPTETRTETYLVEENGEVVAYSFAGGIWMKQPTGQTPEDLRGYASAPALEPEHVTLDETVTQYNGCSVICLKTTVTGEQVTDAMGEMVDSVGQLGENLGATVEALDYSQLRADSVIYLDPETYLPLAQETVLEGMTEMMAPLFQELGMGVEVKDCLTTVTYQSYDSQTPAALPEGAAAAAETWTRLLAGECDNGDGTFTIREGMALADVTHPEGFELVEKDYDHVTFRREDYREITYTMSYITGEETPGSYFLRINDSSERRWNENGGKVERQQMTLTTDTLEFTCDILGTTWSSREDANIYAWAPLTQDAEGIYYLYIEITDGYNNGMGFSKSADLTPEEMMEYLAAAAPSSLMAE